MTPEQALRRLGPALRGARILRRLHAAPVKQSWLVARGVERFVLRVDEPLAARLGLDRAAEFERLQAAWRAGLAPQPLACRPGPPGILVTRYAPGMAWGAAELRRAPRLVRLGQLLRRLHGLQAPGPPLDLERALDAYARRAGGREAGRLAAAGRRLLARWQPETGGGRLCHHDPIAANIVGVRRTLLIDWEYSAPGDPLFDLAVVIAHHRLSAGQQEAFIAAYGGWGPRLSRQRLGLACAVYDHVHLLWLMAMAQQQALAAGQGAALAGLRRQLT